MIRVITFGTFDLFHIGHVRILERARALGDRLTVGISTDDLNFVKKAKRPIHSESDRRDIVAALKCVDEVFYEHSLDLKAEYIERYRADKLVMGHDWEGKFDDMRTYCDVIYLPRTEGISTTEVKQRVTFLYSSGVSQ